MVFFVCEGCNETLKRNQVDKHQYQCRFCQSVTCVDCSVTFYGSDYVQHTTCISEAEKYEKSLFKGKKAKQSPQDAWVALLESATSDISGAPSELHQCLQRLSQMTNVPRNKKKFINFSKNSLRIFNDKLLESLWNYLDNFREKSLETEVTKKEEMVPNIAHDIDDVNKSTAVGAEGDLKLDKASKKKKHKHQAAEEVVSTDGRGSLVVESEVQRNTKSKKRKKRYDAVSDTNQSKESESSNNQSFQNEHAKKKKELECVENVNNEENVNGILCNGSTEPDDTFHKKKKKKKNGDSSNVSATHSNAGEDSYKKKREKKKDKKNRISS